MTTLDWGNPLKKAIKETPAVQKQSSPPKEDANLEARMKPINVKDKRIVNSLTDINQLAPFKYRWAWDTFLAAIKNNWVPDEVDMSNDKSDFNQKLTDEERHVYTNVLAYLTTADILAMRNIGLAVMEKMSAPELQIYQARQVYEEALHTWTYQHCIETLGLEQSEIYNRYRVVPAINQKIECANKRLNAVVSNDLDLTKRDDLEVFALSYLYFAAVFEGCWFYHGFTPIFSLQRRGLMLGTGKQLQYIMRDEVLHCQFGLRVLSTLLEEENLTIDPMKIKAMWSEAESLEQEYIKYLMPDPIVGYSVEEHMEHFRFLANRRMRHIKMSEPFPGAENKLPWLDEQVSAKKMQNFFEGTVTEYQQKPLVWD